MEYRYTEQELQKISKHPKVLLDALPNLDLQDLYTLKKIIDYRLGRVTVNIKRDLFAVKHEAADRAEALSRLRVAQTGLKYANRIISSEIRTRWQQRPESADALARAFLEVAATDLTGATFEMIQRRATQLLQKRSNRPG